MILYLLFFCSCFLIENLRKHKRKAYVFFVVLLFAFLCFGYMTGSDWRGYEYYYGSEDYSRIESKGEIGFIIVTNFFNRFIHDFWLYNGLMKCLYLASLIWFLKCFSHRPYVAIAIGFSNSLLFMLIDCPMRFMMALTLVLVSVVLLISKSGKTNRVISIILLLSSVYLHTSMVVMIGFVSLSLLAPLFSKFNPVIVFCLFVGTFLLAGFFNIFDFIANEIIPMVGNDRFDNYTRKEQNSIITVNTIRYVVLLLILLANKRTILSYNYGAYIYFYSCMYFILFPIAYSIPTMFRLNIFFGLFADISFAHILSGWNRNSIRGKAEGAVILFITLFVLCRNCRIDYKLTPYSNSIPYIISGDHLPYTYRDIYNPSHHETDFWF